MSDEIIPDSIDPIDHGTLSSTAISAIAYIAPIYLINWVPSVTDYVINDQPALEWRLLEQTGALVQLPTTGSISILQPDTTLVILAFNQLLLSSLTPVSPLFISSGGYAFNEAGIYEMILSLQFTDGVGPTQIRKCRTILKVQ